MDRALSAGREEDINQTGCITAWYRSCTALNRKALQREVKAAQHITRMELPSMEDLYTQRIVGGRPPRSLRTPATNCSACCRLAVTVPQHSSPNHQAQGSFILQAIRLLNSTAPPLCNNTVTSTEYKHINMQLVERCQSEGAALFRAPRAGLGLGFGALLKGTSAVLR
ncbi:hypothetical protein L3Q82_012060, partial [Scortum barcoo]